jgi:molybdopterin/thiamine biosynthesis adenylyltransferase
MSTLDFARYQRQMIFAGVQEDGQRRLHEAVAVIVGCGATGSALSTLLARAGVGKLRIVDRDFIELNNLQRQLLFDEDDIRANLPKAEAAARKLRRANSMIDIEPVVSDVNAGNILSLMADATVVLDGTDNFSTRYLLNDACIHLGKPWVYSGVIGSHGMTATFIPYGATDKLPGQRSASGCLRCLLGEMPAPGSTPTCDTAGIIGPAVSLISSIAAAEAMKLIMGRGDLNPGLIYMDVWSHEYEHFGGGVRNPTCLSCGQRQFEFLNARVGATSSSLCGRNAVQVAVMGAARLDLARLELNLLPVATRIVRNDHLLRAQIDGYEFTIFPDNRAIIKGTEDEDLAKTLYARYIGS